MASERHCRHPSASADSAEWCCRCGGRGSELVYTSGEGTSSYTACDGVRRPCGIGRLAP